MICCTGTSTPKTCSSTVAKVCADSESPPSSVKLVSDRSSAQLLPSVTSAAPVTVSRVGRPAVRSSVNRSARPAAISAYSRSSRSP